jgi:two-component system CheB/CheR fusion protein
MESERNLVQARRVEDILITAELERRPLRAPDHAAENRAMAALARQLADDPGAVPQKLAELLLELCRADSAGVSLLDNENGREVFRWNAAAGLLAPVVGGRIDRDASPCGMVVDRNCLVLLKDPECVYPALQVSRPPMRESLLLPWTANGKATGTVWVISQSPDRHFDGEDARLVQNLASFAAAAYQAIVAQQETAAGKRALRASEDTFLTLADTAPGLIWRNDEQGHNLFVNRYFLDFTGKPAEEILGTGWHAILHPDDADDYIDGYLDALHGRRAYRRQIRLRRRDGQWRWFDSCGHPLFTPERGYAGHVGIALDITDAVQAEQALKEAGQRKDEFLATLAHELRNPLAPISNAVQLLRRPDGRRKADRLIEMVGRQVHQIVKLVDDLMEISRITSGKIALEKRAVPLSEVVAGAVETSRPLIDQARHTLLLSLPGESLLLDADSVRLTQVLANLLNNAARYTDAGGRIELAARRDDGEAVISVRDNGIGIPPDQLPHIFDMFTQVHRTAARSHGGLGIGLAMVRNLVQMHGGSVEARSAGPGQGSEFVVRLPLRAQAAPGQPDAQSARAAPQPLSGRRILVVDDNRDAAESLAMLLQIDGAEVSVVHDGRAALAALEQECAEPGPDQGPAQCPDAVLLDLGMPGMDGIEVARRIRLDPRLRRLRIAALTGWGQESDRARTHEAGFDFHLTKPADLGLLEAWLLSN